MTNLTAENVLLTWGKKAEARGANPVILIQEQAEALAATSTAVAAAVGGSESDRLDLIALFKLRKFAVQADSFTETNAWLHGLLDTLSEIASTVAVAGGKLAVQALVEALKGAIAAGE